MRYRVYDKQENNYPDNQHDFFLGSDDKLYKKSVYMNAPTATRATVTIEEADPSRYVVEEGVEIEGKVFHIGDVLIRSSSILKQSFKNRIVFDKGCFCIRVQDLQTKEWLNSCLSSYVRDESIARYELKIIGTIHDKEV